VYAVSTLPDVIGQLSDRLFFNQIAIHDAAAKIKM
jgi:hypothetical protein